MEASPRSSVPTSSGKPSQQSGGCYSSKGGAQLHINAHDFGIRCSSSRCPHTFGHVVCVCVCTFYIYTYIQWGKKVFSQPPFVQVLPLKKMREACNFHHRYTSTMTNKMRKKNPENHIVGFLMNLFANYGGK